MNPRFVKTLVWVGLYIVTGLLVISVLVWAPHGTNDFPVLRDFIIFFATVLLCKYFLYMSLSPWYDVARRARDRRTKIAGIYRPRVSIIIPAWNEAVGLPETLKTIVGSTYRNLEVVVVNDGSTDNSNALMRKFITKYNAQNHNRTDAITLKYFYKENGGKGRALNYGIERSTGEIIITIDADCILTPHTVTNFVKPFADPKIMAAVGNVKIGNTAHVLGTLQYLEFLFSFYFKKADSLMNTIYIIGGAAGAFRRSVFDRVGTYNSNNITEDIDLSVRIQKAGMRIIYVADAIVYTEGAGTFKSLQQQRLRWKYGRFQTFIEHRHFFFSNEARHNQLLTWVVLPLAIFGDVQLFFELLFLVFLYIYSFLTHDFSSFISGLIVVSAMFTVQLFNDDSPKSFALYALAPVGWLLFYLTTIIEHRALFKSIALVFSKQKLRWQRWQRTGCLDSVSAKALDTHA